MITSLRNKGVLVEGNFNRLKIDRTKWYAIDYERLQELDAESLATSMWPDCPHGTGQDDQVQVDNLATPLPENTTENTTETSSHVAVPPNTVRCSIHDTVMKKRGPDAEGNIWWSHKVGSQWCQGAPGDQWAAPEERREGRNPEDYISGKYSDLVQY